MAEPDAKEKCIRELLHSLPTDNYNIMVYLFDHFIRYDCLLYCTFSERLSHNWFWVIDLQMVHLLVLISLIFN